MLSEIFKNAFLVYTKSFRYILVISLFVNIPRNSIMFFIPDRWMITFEMITQLDFEGMLPAMLISYAVAIIFAPLAYAGYAHVMREAIAGNEINLPGILDNTLLKWPALLITSFMYYAFIFVGSMLIFPAIYVLTVFALYVMVVVDRDKWGMAALLESARIVKGSFFRTLLVLMLVSALSSILGSFVGYAVYTQNDFANRIVNILMFTFRDTFAAYFSMVIVAYYFYLLKLRSDDNASGES